MAEEGNYCIPAFNVYNTETVMGIIDAAEQEKAPVIIQVYPRLLNQEVGFYLCPAVVAAAQRASVPVCFHLDHGPSEWEVTRALRWGCTGIMPAGLSSLSSSPSLSPPSSLTPSTSTNTKSSPLSTL